MSSRTPFVSVGGSEGGSDRFNVTQVAHGFVLPAHGVLPLVYDNTAGEYVLAKADDKQFAADVLAVGFPDANTIQVQEGGRLALTHGLTVGVWYTLSKDVAGEVYQADTLGETDYQQLLFFTSTADLIVLRLQKIEANMVVTAVTNLDGTVDIFQGGILVVTLNSSGVAPPPSGTSVFSDNFDGCDYTDDTDFIEVINDGLPVVPINTHGTGLPYFDNTVPAAPGTSLCSFRNWINLGDTNGNNHAFAVRTAETANGSIKLAFRIGAVTGNFPSYKLLNFFESNGGGAPTGARNEVYIGGGADPVIYVVWYDELGFLNDMNITGFEPAPDTWYELEIRWKLNTVGNADGEYEVLVNGSSLYLNSAFEWIGQVATGIDFINVSGTIEFSSGTAAEEIELWLDNVALEDNS